MPSKLWGLGAAFCLGLMSAVPASAGGLEPGVVVSGGSASDALEGPGASVGPLDYDSAESAGEIQPDREVRFAATVTGFRSGFRYANLGDTALLAVEHGASLAPGEDYVAFRDEGEVGEAVPGAGASGRLLRNVAVLRILRASKRGGEARVVKLYGTLTVGDELRSRADRRGAYGRLLDLRPQGKKPLKGVVVGMLSPEIEAAAGDFVYLNVGFDRGAVPGLRLTVVSDPDADAADFGSDDDSRDQAQSPVRPLEQSDEESREWPNGAIGTVEVVNASKSACVARVLKCVGAVSLGDQVVRP